MPQNATVRAKRRPRSGKVLVPLLLAVLIGGVGAFATLVGLGQIKVDLSPISSLFGSSQPDEVETQPVSNVSNDPPADSVRVLMTTKEIPAYTAITREHFRDPNSGDPSQLYYAWVEEAQADRVRVSLQPGSLFGRVTRGPISAATIISEDVLFPVGTRPGPAAGVPAGQSLATIDAAELTGIESLRIYDRFDILATFPPSAAGASSAPRVRGVEQAISRDMLNESGSAPEPEVRLIASAARVIEPVFSDDGRGRDMRFSFCADPEELVAYEEAIAHGAKLRAIARSNRPDGNLDGDVDLPVRTADSESSDTGIEAIVGGKKTVIVFPDRGN